MAWLSDYSDMKAVRGRAQQAMGLPLGMASPLWLAFGAATTAGVAWWLMTRWTQALNVEALAGAAETTPPAPIRLTSLDVPEEVYDAPLEPVLAEPELETASEEMPEAVVAPEHWLAPAPDDLTRLVGIGPKLAAALAEHGVTSFTHIAAWTADDIAKFDRELSLKGRAVRDAWVAQASRMIDAA